jgi:hypothetical protein
MTSMIDMTGFVTDTWSLAVSINDQNHGDQSDGI